MELTKETDPRIEAFYRKEKLQTIPKWVTNNQLYKNWLHLTGQMERLSDYKKARKAEIRQYRENTKEHFRSDYLRQNLREGGLH